MPSLASSAAGIALHGRHFWVLVRASVPATYLMNRTLVYRRVWQGPLLLDSLTS